jgi:N-acetylglucosaminyldiphosphoundecaprenol N-acetyl-beta-D-mannosaminyltransferase
MNDSRVHRVLNIDFHDTTMESLLNEFRAGVVFPLNIDTMMTLQHDEEFYAVCRKAEYRVLDSQVLNIAARVTGHPFQGKISGSDLFPRFCSYHRTNEAVSIFVLGGFDDVPAKVQDILNREAGRQIVVGAYSPPPGFESSDSENHAIVDMINASGATVLVVGVGAPKQEKWIMRHRAACTNVTMFMAVGATLDFIAGRQQRAPVWMQKSGLEWLHRMAGDPGRMVHRYLVRDIPFFYHFLRDVAGMYTNPFKG